MEHFYFEEELFEVLYNLAVGLERLEKIAVVLIEHVPGMIQDDFERTLITHNHIELLNRIKKKHKLNLGKSHIKFLQLLTDFYRSARYGRYNMESVYSPNREQDFITFIETELSIKIDNEAFMVTPNNDRIRRFVGRQIEKIALQLYEIIQKETGRLRIFSDEIRNESKAYKIFMAKQFNFEPERYLQRELFVYLFNAQQGTGFREFMSSIKPLPFESYDIDRYIKFIMNFHHHVNLQDELNTIAEDQPLSKDRIEQVSIIGTGIDYEMGYEDEELEDL